MDVADLETFEAVARTGGITRAARELHTVQSNVTGALARFLECCRPVGRPGSTGPRGSVSSPSQAPGA